MSKAAIGVGVAPRDAPPDSPDDLRAARYGIRSRERPPREWAPLFTHRRSPAQATISHRIPRPCGARRDVK